MERSGHVALRDWCKALPNKLHDKQVKFEIYAFKEREDKQSNHSTLCSVSEASFSFLVRVDKSVLCK